VPGKLAALRQDVGGSNGEVDSEFGGDVSVGETPDPIGSE
jgi:hypothetical protein